MLLVLVSIGAVLLAALLTMPWARSAGPGRLIAFALLSIVGVTGALVLVTSGLLPGTEDVADQEASSERGEQTRELMITELGSMAGVPVSAAPSVEELSQTEGPTVWRLEGGSVLCVAEDFPASAEMACWVPDVVVAEGMSIDDTRDGSDIG